MHFYRPTIYQRGGSQALSIKLFLYISLSTLTSISKLLEVKFVSDATEVR